MKFDPQAKLNLDEIERMISSKSKFVLSPRATARISGGAKSLKALAASREPLYGVNTGFGRLAQMRVSPAELTELQVNLLRSHAAGIGDPASQDVVRRLIFLRALSLGKGASGVSVSLVKRHLEYLNFNLIPHIPEQGSVGASGDLAPLAHLGLTFIGEGYFLDRRRKMRGILSLKRYRLKPLEIGPKEGLALVNGTQFSLALALQVRSELSSLLDWMMLAACVSIEGHRASRNVFDPELHALKDHPHQKEIAALFWKLLSNSPHMKGHKDCDLVQDSYSFRCIPQILGPCLSLLDRADDLLTDEANSVTDNPLLVSKGKRLISGGHFHAQSVSMACDLMALSMATMGNLIERRIDQLVSPLTTRTEAFLADRPGVQSGFMIVQTAAAALASENKTLAHPASIDTIPTNGNQEDHVSMAPWAARKALMMVKNLRRLVAAEILCAARACVLESHRTGLAFSPPVEGFLDFLGSNHPQIFKLGDRAFGEDWIVIEKLIEAKFTIRRS